MDCSYVLIEHFTILRENETNIQRFESKSTAVVKVIVNHKTERQKGVVHI